MSNQPPTTPSENFADHPLTIGELRSERTHEAGSWSPRELLISLLREIDRGEIDSDALVVAFRRRHPDGSTGTGFRVSSPDFHVTVGLLDRAKWLVHRD